MTKACALVHWRGGGVARKRVHLHCRIGKFTERCDQMRAEGDFHVSHGGGEY